MSSQTQARPLPEPFSPIEISRTPKIRQIGKEWRGPCPNHGGPHDSFAVESETGAWFCHSKCGRGGSLFDLEMELPGTPFPEAAAEARLIAGRAELRRRGPIVSTYNYEDLCASLRNRGEVKRQTDERSDNASGGRGAAARRQDPVRRL